MSWRDAFFRQAKSDYFVFKKLNDSKFSLCHKLHYLQMATEKLAKAYLCKPSGGPPKRTHYALVRMLKLIKGRRDIRRELGYQNDFYAYVSYIDSLLDLADKIQKLVPVGDKFDEVNAEYPWKDTAGSIQCPTTYTFPEFPKTDLVKFQALVCNLFRMVS